MQFRKNLENVLRLGQETCHSTFSRNDEAVLIMDVNKMIGRRLSHQKHNAQRVLGQFAQAGREE